MSTTFSVLRSGPMTTVQDAGRPGLLHAGVSGSGPMDPPLFAIANALVGNADAAAGLEFAGMGGEFSVSAPVRVAVTGDADVRIAGEPVAAWESHDLLSGQTLRVGALQRGVWGYLAVSGGIATPPVLGSRATHLRTGIGGHEGRTLKAGDTLPLGETVAAPCLRMAEPFVREEGPIRVVPGPQDDYFDESAWDLLAGDGYTVSPTRDRMAQALEGPKIAAVRGHDIVSDGTPLGSLQVPGSGRPMVLMAERQTTGGYPKIGAVASVDLPRLGQISTGQPVRFVRISREDAENLLIDARRALRSRLADLMPKAGLVCDSGFLLDVNLIDGVAAVAENE
jgi:5-oxoprolinase (ATP-hydrolysing) subunit C